MLQHDLLKPVLWLQYIYNLSLSTGIAWNQHLTYERGPVNDTGRVALRSLYGVALSTDLGLTFLACPLSDGLANKGHNI